MTTVSRLCAAAAIILGVTTGCSNSSIQAGNQKIPLPSPVAGSWTGEAKLNTGNDLVKIGNKLSGDKMTGASSLKLNADGTGFMKVAKGAEKPITWKAEDRKVIIDSRSIDNSKPAEGSKDGPYVGTLSEDKKTLSIDMGDVKVILNHS